MERFSYLRPRDVQEAIDLLNEPGMRNFVLAGGTDLMLILRQDRSLTGRLIDISQLPELRKIENNDGLITIGAAASFAEVHKHPVIQSTAPVLAQAAGLVGATQIRNMGTIGGNVANAAACADSIPALVCLDAIVVIRNREGETRLPVADFIISPNKTRLPAGGLITAFEYRVPDESSRSVFLKLGRRNAMAISRLTVAALGRVSTDKVITEARFVTGSATPRITRLEAVENSLIGARATMETVQIAAQLAVDEMIRLAGKRWSSEFKMPALTAMATRAFCEVFSISDEKETVR